MPSAVSHETLVRQLQMLQLIPRSPAQITVGDLTRSLSELGFGVTSRTVQRDLNDIATVMPLECNNLSKPYGWKWARDAKAHLPMMSLREALTLHLVSKHLSHVLPPNMLEDLSPLFIQAEQTITHLGTKNQVAHWLACVAVVSPTQPMLAPKISLDIQHTVYQAVFEQKQLEVVYQSVFSGSTKSLLLHPLGLVLRGEVIYLGATVKDYEDIRFFALHRMEKAEIKPLDDAQSRNQISWQDYLASGSAGFNLGVNEPITLIAWVNTELAGILRETPLNEGQELVACDEGFTLTVNVFDTWQLSWWILSQGAKIVVKAPEKLKTTIKNEINLMYQHYQN